MTIEQAWDEFHRNERSPVWIEEGVRFAALCPVCGSEPGNRGGEVVVSQNGGPSPDYECDNGCDPSVIGGALAAKDAQAKAFAHKQMQKASALLGVGKNDPIVGVYRPISAGVAPMTAVTAMGRELRWECQRDMIKPSELVFPVLATEGMPGPKKPLTQAQAQATYKALVEACTTLERVDNLDEARAWGDGFMALCDLIVVGDDDSDEIAYERLQDFRDVEPLSKDRLTWDPRALQAGEWRHVRRQDLATYVRVAHDVVISLEALTARMGEVGWQHTDIQMWTPNVPRSQARHLRVRAYRQLVA